MNQLQMDFNLLTVEILMATLGLVVLVLGLLIPKNQSRGIAYFTTIGLVAILLYSVTMQWTKAEFLNGMYLIDPFSTLFKQIFLLTAILVSVGSYQFMEKYGHNQAEYYSLMVFATLGMMVMASAGDLITLYIGLELMTISLCVLTCFRLRDAKSSEAGIKYIILGAMSSAIMLYGLSLVYGMTRTTVIAEIAAAIALDGVSPLLLLGLVFLVAGFAFKISAVPFHIWAPDIYEGAPTPVTAFLAVASKAAGFAAMMRVLLIALPDLFVHWNVMIVGLTVLTVVLANLVAIPQTNIKRLLAFSGVGQAGYLLLGIVAFTQLGVGAVLFHTLFYVFANVAAFMVVIAFYNETGSDEIRDYTGLAVRSPLLAAVLLFSMLSMAGIPPLAGFVSKFYLFTAVIDQGYVWLALISVLMSMVSVYYYLIVAKVMYIGKPADDAKPIKVSSGLQIALILCLVMIFAFGIYPAPFTDLAMNVANTFFTP